ncbi:MAG: YibE/F family protein [Cellulosilyticaceae bacterium]
MGYIKQALHNKNIVFSLICLVASIVLLMLPTGFEKQMYSNSEGVKAKVVTTDESGIMDTGLIRQGAQVCEIQILSGSHKGKQVEAVNLLAGKMEFDKIFEVGDKAFVILEQDLSGEILFANMVDHYRINLELMLLGIFLLALVLFSGSVGVRTMISFLFSMLCIWKLLVPLLLKGYHPMLLALVIGLTMATVTLLLVAGFTKKAYCAILGSTCASLVTCVMAMVFGQIFKIHGAVMPWSESLLYAGFGNLNLTLIYQSAIYLSCSGAIVDLAIDISAAIEEIVDKKPEITKREILISGFNVGRSVVGSQATTLLLAYMGSFITVMMVYMAQGTPMMSIFNSKSIASEVLHTLIGCIGLVIVSPLTTVICSVMYSHTLKLKDHNETRTPL